MKDINVQNTQTYILDVPATPWADCTAAVTAILAGKKIGCTQALGDLVRTRAITEYSCIDSNSSSKAAGVISYSDFDIEMLFDPEDTAGQGALLTAFNDNKPIIFAYESPDIDTSVGTTGASGTIVWTNAVLSGDAISYSKDGKVGYKVTVSPYGGFSICKAVAGHA